MSRNIEFLPEEFFVVGISYKNTDAATRSGFSVFSEQYQDIIQLAPSFGVNNLFVLSTCNRCEFYGCAKNALALLQLFQSQMANSSNTLKTIIYQKKSFSAINHLYRVGCGLDSQILGDYEIVGQLKQAIDISRKQNFLGPFLERLTNSVLQASKKIKTHTKLSNGSVSVSFAAAKFIRQQVEINGNKKILIIGAGKIGRSICKNLVSYIDPGYITVANRSPEKAIALIKELQINYCPQELLSARMSGYDIIVAATNSPEPVIFASHFDQNIKEKTIIDLSVPCNIENEVQGMSGIEIIHLDQISKTKDDNLKTRIAEIPKAEAIIENHTKEFFDWVEKRKLRTLLQANCVELKEALQFERKQLELNQYS